MGVTGTATLLSADHHVLKYRLTASGAGTGSIPNATLLANAVLGSPLWNVFNTAAADQAAARNLLLFNANVRVTVVERAVVRNMIIDANVAALRGIYEFTAAAQDDAATGGCVMTIEYRHTTVR